MISKRRKIINAILFVVFTAFAIMQLNDADGWVWFSIYIAVALICLYSVFKMVPKGVLWVVILGLLTYSGFHLSLFIDYLQTKNKAEIFGEMVYEKPYLEGSREFLGLLMAALGIIYQLKGRKN